MLATKLILNSAIFQELEKGDVIAMKGYVTNGQLSLEILFGMLPLEAANT